MQDLNNMDAQEMKHYDQTLGGIASKLSGIRYRAQQLSQDIDAVVFNDIRKMREEINRTSTGNGKTI